MSHSPTLNSSEKNFTEKSNIEQLFIKFTKEIEHHEKSKILFLLVQEYIHCFKNELETKVEFAEFLQLISQVPLLCEKFLQISESNCIDDVVNKSKNLESASTCFHVLLLCLETFSMTNEYLTMIKIALNILSQGYTHCKESEIIYDNLLEQFGDKLGAFFKKIENLQTVVLHHLDKLDVAQNLKDDMQLNFIIIEMGNLCQIVFSLDADVAFELWPKYLRMISEYKSLPQILNIKEICTFIASKNADLLLSVKLIIESDSEEDDELAAKFFFYLDALSDLMNLIHDSFMENKLSFASVLLDCLILSYSPFIIEKTSLNIIKSSLKKNAFTLVSHLCTDEDFLATLPFVPLDTKFHPTTTILLKLYSLKCAESISLELRENLLRKTFSDLLSYGTDDDMKLLYISVPQCAVSKAKSDECITLYQLAYETIADSLRLMPNSVIEKMEAVIFNFLVSSSDITFLLVSDAWIYRLRCSTVEFLKERCYAALQNLHKENINNYKIENITKRMLRFLPTSYKDILLETFSSLSFIQENKNIEHRYGIPEHSSTENEIKINSADQIKKMICELSENSSNDSNNLIKMACYCLELCTFFSNVAGCCEIFQFLELASALFKTDIYEIQISTLSLLKSLSRKTMPEHHQEFGKIVTLLAQLFSETMHSKNYIVRYEALNIFSYFAKCTPHLKIVKETVKLDPTLKSILISYMNAIPEDNFLSEKDKVEYLQKQVFMSRSKKLEISAKAVESLQQLFSKANLKLLI